MASVISPLMTEKSVVNLDKGLYVFNVTRSATKASVADELKKLYGVDALSVRIVNLPAKKVNFRRLPGVRPARRKAYIQLAAKQQIAGFELPKQDTKETKEKAK